MVDLLIDIENGSWDLRASDGDFVLGDATKQNQGILLACAKGEIALHPTDGVGVFAFMDDEGPADLLREIRRQFTKDGMEINTLGSNPTTGEIEVDAFYI